MSKAKSKVEKEAVEVERTPEAEVAARLASQKARYVNKQRTLVLSSRGITSRYRHFMLDLEALMPHSKRESKFDSKEDMSEAPPPPCPCPRPSPTSPLPLVLTAG